MIEETLEKIKIQISELPKKKVDEKEQAFIQHYLGNKRHYLGAKTGDVLKIAKNLVKEQDSFEIKELIDLLSRLFAARTFEEYVIGGKIFTLLKPEIRAKIPYSQLEIWLSKATGWVEVDVICQSTYTEAEVLANWHEWEVMIKKFRESSNISLRRASLVLQNPSVRKSNNKKLSKLAFETIEKLKGEREVLITKAISWLLRCLTVYHKEEVRKYLLENESTLPRIAFRETMKKIETGKK